MPLLSGPVAGTSTWATRRFGAMGTVVELAAHGVGGGELARAEAEVHRLESTWSRFRAGSALTALNADPRTEVPVPPALAAAVARAVAGRRLTDGRFDPTTLDALVAAGYDADFAELDDPGRRVPPPPPRRPPTTGALVEVLDGERVRRPPGVRLDLGGIGKGLAADLVVGSLLAAGARSAFASVGGDVRVGGVPPVDGWRVPVEDPFLGGTWMVLAPVSGAVCASSTRVRRWQLAGGGWGHHLVDPTTGAPADAGVTAAVVTAAEAWWAEVLATAALVAGPAAGAELLRRHGATGWLVLDDTTVVPVAP